MINGFTRISPIDRPDYRALISDVSQAVWPEFMLHDPIANEHWDGIFANFAAFQFALVHDESQAVAKAYDAACTPDLFLFDSDLSCYYRGQFDSARPSNDDPVTGSDLRNALDNLLAGNPTDPQQTPSMGCNIKWKDA